MEEGQRVKIEGRSAGGQGGRKLLRVVLSLLLFAALVSLLVCSAHFQALQKFLLNHFGQLIGGFVASLAQALQFGGGGQRTPHGGDLLAFLMFLIMFIDLMTRHSNRFYRFQHWAATNLSLSPFNMIALSFGIALSYLTAADADHSLQSAHPPAYVQLLVLLIFTTAMYSLFSASDAPKDSELSTRYRLPSRMMEYCMYTCFFPNYPAIWRWQFMAPLGLLVCVSRSNQIFRIWQNNRKSCSELHDHVIVRKKFKRLYELASERIAKDLAIISWPGGTYQLGYSATGTYLRYSAPDPRAKDADGRIMLIKQAVKEEGMYGYKAWRPYSQYCFFWSAGSGVLLSSGIILLTVILISAFQLVRVSNEYWSLQTMGTLLPAAGVFLFLVSQSLPAFVVFVADINDADPDWKAWFRQISTFIWELLSEGIPLKKLAMDSDTPGLQEHEPWFDEVMAVVRGCEGVELIFHTVVFALARLIGLGMMFGVLTLARKTKLGSALHWIWVKLEPDLAFYSAKITAPDVIRVKAAFLQAEYALDTRIQPCSVKHPEGSSTRCNTLLQNVKNLLDDLNKALRGEMNSTGFYVDGTDMAIDLGNDETQNSELSTQTKSYQEKLDNAIKQAIAAGLYTSTMDTLRELKGFESSDFPVGMLAARLHPILSLLSRLYLDKAKCEGENVHRVIDRLDRFTEIRDYSGLCYKESDVKLMRVQLQVSMLLYHFDEPGILHSITGITLHEWLETRRKVKGIELCDFLEQDDPGAGAVGQEN